MKLFAVLLIFLCSFQASHSQRIMEPADRPVELKGTIRQIQGFGPPGYDEDKRTDKHVIYLALETPLPINIPCTPERPEWAPIDCRPTKRLKLFFFSSSHEELELTAKKLIGKKVVLTGTLKRADTAGEMTAIYVEVAAIEASAAGS